MPAVPVIRAGMFPAESALRKLAHRFAWPGRIGDSRPLDLELRGGLDDLVLDRADDADEVALLDDLDVRQVLDRARVDLERLREAVRQPRALARPDPAPVQHARHA